MPDLEVRLLGRPEVRVDGAAVAPPRGAKAWGLLAYLVATGRSHRRPELAELLFGEAADPLGALRWNLAALRRLLDRPEALKGEVVALDLPGATIDIHLVERGDVSDLGAIEQLDLGAELLAGLSFGDSPDFELWLLGERHRLGRRAAALLQEAALRRLARGEHHLAVGDAKRLVALDRFDEGNHALLIRAHALAGDPAGAERCFQRCRALLRDELATEPGPAVVAAAHLAGTLAGTVAGPIDEAELGARMAVAWQSFLAGAIDHAIDLGRSVVATADRAGDASLRTTARLFLGGMLSMSVRGWDECSLGSTEALELAERAGLAHEEAMARSVLAGNDLMRAHFGSAVAHATAGAARCEEPGVQALNRAFLGAAELELGRWDEAVADTGLAVELATATDDPLATVYASAYAGQVRLVVGDVDGARPHLERAVAAAAALPVLRPWPMAVLAELEVEAGRLDLATALATRAGAMAASTDVAYQRGLALRALALADAARGDHIAATERLVEGLAQARRTTGEGYTFHWPVAWILDSLARTTAVVDPVASRRWAEALLAHAAPIGMVTFVGRAEALLAPA